MHSIRWTFADAGVTLSHPSETERDSFRAMAASLSRKFFRLAGY